MPCASPQAQKGPLGAAAPKGRKGYFKKRVCKAGLASLLSLLKYDDHRGVCVFTFLECTGV